MKLQANMKAPEFDGMTLDGHQISSDALLGKNILLKFYRYAACPVCNLQVQDFVKQIEMLNNSGITIVMVFHSPLESLEKNLRTKVPFPLIADARKQIYRKYEVDVSWGGMFSWAVIRDTAKGLAKGFITNPIGSKEKVAGHPADFIIDGDGIIRYAHYGKNWADSLSADEALRIIQGLNLANA